MGKRPKRTTAKEQVAAAQTAAFTLMDIPESQPLPLHFESPESSSIAAGTYDPFTQTLTVHFKPTKAEPGGRRYQFSGYEEAMWREFLEAESKGHFFSARIRPFYVGVRL